MPRGVYPRVSKATKVTAKKIDKSTEDTYHNGYDAGYNQAHAEFNEQIENLNIANMVYKEELHKLKEEQAKKKDQNDLLLRSLEILNRVVQKI